jgi:hypothetical protein
MIPVLKHLALGATALVVAMTLASAPPHFAAFAQSTAASAPMPLPEGTVKALQEALRQQGIAVKPSGILDDESRAAIRQYQSQHHLPVTGEPDKATLDKLGVVGQGGQLSGGSQSTGETFRGQAMGDMGPGMMGRVAGQGMPQGGMAQGRMGPDMVGQGQMPMAGGMMMCPMMQMAMGDQPDMNMPGTTDDPAMLYGMPHAAREEMTPERVRAFLEQRLAQTGNPRLKIGEIATTPGGSISAEIVTVDGSLVQKLAFNRYPGLYRQVQ